MPATLLGLPLRTLRLGAATFLALDAIAVGAFSVHVHHVTTTSDAKPAAAIGAAAPGAVPSAAPLPAGGAAPVGGAALANTAQSISSGGSAGGSGTTSIGPSATASPTSAPSTGTTPSPSASDGAEPLGSAGPAGTGDHNIAPCPITVSSATPAAGGLQSVVEFAPAFGPFSPEAFAAASAYQPALELVGPLLAQYPQLQPVIGPYAETFVNTVSGITGAIGSLAGPLYTPARKTQVVDAETKLASVLAPYAESLAYSSLGGCVVELESALVQHTGQQAPSPSGQPALPTQAARQAAPRSASK